MTGVAPCPSDVAIVDFAAGTPISAIVLVTDAICYDACDGAAQVNASGGYGSFQYQWPAGLAGGTDSIADGVCAGTYAMTIMDALGCTGEVDFSVGQPPPLVVDGVHAQAETCIGSCDGWVQVIDPVGVAYSADNGMSWQGSPHFMALCAGTYALLMQDAYGCHATIEALVASPPPVVADFITSPDTVTVEAPVVQFINQSLLANAFMWQFADLGSSTVRDPSFTFPDGTGGEYEVCLTAVDDAGCMDSICRPIVVRDILIVFAPNAFSPNADGWNDGFTPVVNLPSQVEDYELLIFDRWGERIFESQRLGDAWDGTISGQEAKLDVYVWKLSARDGATGRLHERTGSVTLLR